MAPFTLIKAVALLALSTTTLAKHVPYPIGNGTNPYMPTGATGSGATYPTGGFGGPGRPSAMPSKDHKHHHSPGSGQGSPSGKGSGGNCPATTTVTVANTYTVTVTAAGGSTSGGAGAASTSPGAPPYPYPSNVGGSAGPTGTGTGTAVSGSGYPTGKVVPYSKRYELRGLVKEKKEKKRGFWHL